jgi:DNA invertase Pin-like site-specific DNA recombinase
LIKKAAIYVRVSCPDEPQSQVNNLRELAQQRGFEIVAYEDRGTGTKRRLGLEALMADSRQGRFEAVFVDSFDRLARSTKHFLQVMVELDELGIQFISCQENVDTSIPMGRVFLTHCNSILKLESALNRGKIRAGLRRRKLEGLPLGRIPLAIDHVALVHDRLSGKSLTQCSKKYGVSRSSVVRFVRLAQEANAVPGNLSLAAQREVLAAACVA